MNIVTVDFETRGVVDLGERGVFTYAPHPLTEIMCLAVKWNAERAKIFINPKFHTPEMEAQLKYQALTKHELIEYLRRADYIVAHNSMFEYKMWEDNFGPRFGFDPLKLNKIIDTMALAAYSSLPLGLDNLCEVLDLGNKKSKEGHKLMLKMCKPRAARKAECAKLEDAGYKSKDKKCWVNADGKAYYLWHETPEQIAGLFNYACMDVDAEYDAFCKLSPMNDFERRVWLLDQKINLRGVPADIDNVKTIVSVLSTQEEKLLKIFKDTVGEDVSSPRSYKKLAEWICSQGVETSSVDKNSTKEMLERDDLPTDVKTVLKVKTELGKASTAKLRAIINKISPDNRIRGMFQYGAASTLRWGGRAVQPHNLPRDSYKPEVAEIVFDLFRAGNLDDINILFGEPYQVASKCIRALLMASPGKVFVCSDFSGVEARGLPYLANDWEALQVFIEGKDPYIVAAMAIFNKPYDDIDKMERLVGKVVILALGFGGGIGAFASMAWTYGIDLETLPPLILPSATAEELDGDYGSIALAKTYCKLNPDDMSLKAAVACDIIKRRWRADRGPTVRFWKNLYDAACSAVKNPNTVYRVNKIKYCSSDGFLKCMLPSGRIMHYWDPKFKELTTSWGELKTVLTYMGMKIDEKTSSRKWVDVGTYGGKLAENCIAGNALVLTDHGWVRLKDVAFYHKLWDGVEWVSHSGVIFKGCKQVMRYDGVQLTPDHRILTREGWRQAYEAIRFDRKKVCLNRYPKWPYDGSPSIQGLQNKYNDDTLSIGSQVANEQAIHTSGYTEQSVAGVYDIMNSGPRNRFVVLGNRGPFIVHNCTQAFCRDLLAYSMVKLDEAGFNLIFHVHDEPEAEEDENNTNLNLELFEKIMVTPPPWAEGMPIEAEGWVGKRYRK